MLVRKSESFWRDRSVMVTGHSGFKGSWLALWLHEMGATVHGYSQCPPTSPSLFDIANVQSALSSDTRADLRDLETLRRSFAASNPSVVFHLAAQPLVRDSFRDPLSTFNVNVMGVANVLEVVRTTESVRAVVIVTTDKVYENREWIYPYRENDPLGGYDPYSASKAAAEIVTASYRSSFFPNDDRSVTRVASARAGNVIGGGDWAKERLIPDCLAAFARHQPVRLRFPAAVRPWQHVLEALQGYLLLAEKLFSNKGGHFGRAWNFGPDASGDASVGQLANLVAKFWGGDARVEAHASSDNPHEAGLLRLDSTLARSELGWQPRWPLPNAVEKTVLWHQAWRKGEDMNEFTRHQIREYVGSWML